ncbi:MBL fold metallo-hydrolase [Paenibacillus agilis]|uniref:MBL fold metallo-hydrolase n=1 Tax=Paenibacillus agilis TaxID=3020863 RepID=A0A559IXQ6_9BACL|nr:MBL fold metallo-hydrolase [Paenibacillus agilis]TVX92422.1 MBL fold metallo-hydrolase [Paenibacillus agilis]
MNKIKVISAFAAITITTGAANLAISYGDTSNQLQPVSAAVSNIDTNETEFSPVGAKYVNPSSTRMIQSGEKIGNLFNLNAEQPYVLQRLTKNTYWVQAQYYGTTFYVGSKGVMVFDPLEYRSEQVLKAIRQVTKLPITTIVYSHAHADHINGTSGFLKALEAEGQKKPRIVASKATAEKLAYVDSKIPRPTELVAWPKGKFKFENQVVELHGFDRAAHTDDHAAWLIKGEKVLHAPDLLNPDQPSFWNFAGSENFVYLEQNYKDVLKLDWKWLNGGHGNVGEKKDINFHLAFIADLKKAVSDAMVALPYGNYVDSSKGAHTAYLAEWMDAVSVKATDTLRPKYGKLYGFEHSTPANAKMVAFKMYSYQ